MTPREVLSANLQKLMDMKGWTSFADVIEASDGRLTNGTLDRIRRKATGCSVDHLQALGDVFGVEPWMLLVDSLTVKDGRVAGLSSAWPFHGIMTPEQWADLPGTVRDQIRSGAAFAAGPHLHASGGSSTSPAGHGQPEAKAV